MPFYLDEMDIIPEAGITSVLLVPCRFCPAASLAVRNSAPYIELARSGLETPSYASMIERLKRRLEGNGLTVGVFRSPLPHQFVLCMWTSRRRNRLMRVARDYDALVVLGCEAAVETVRRAVASTSCRVYPGMKNEGIMSIRPKFSLPCNVSLDLEGVTPIVLKQP